MNIEQLLKDKRAKIIIPLALIVVILLVLQLFIPEKQEIPPVEVTPTPTSLILPTSAIPSPTIETSQGDPNFYESKRPQILEGYPLIDYIPYKTEDYSVHYTDRLTLLIILKKDTPEIRQEAYDWILSKGVDPKTHTITWKTQ